MPKKEIFVLYIEDEEPLHEAFKKEVEIFNEDDTDITIVATTVLNIEDARSILGKLRFDAVVTDLKIAKGSADHDAVAIGNEFIKSLKGVSPCLIAVLTGKPSDVDSSNLDNDSMAKFTKESDAEAKIFNWIKSKLSVITLMRGAFNTLNEKLAPLFHGGVATRLSKSSNVLPIDAALRMILENVADSILTSSSATNCDPQESYIHPVVRGKIMTGDLIKHDEKTWMILSPACDITRCNDEYGVLLAQCEPHEKYQTYIQRAEKGDFDSLQKLINQSNNLYSHFLPPLNKGEDPFIVNFKSLVTVPYNKLTIENVIASVSPKFLPNLIHRFSAFIGRPGAPDIDTQLCLQHSKK